MIGETAGPLRFVEALGIDANSAFVKLRSEIMKTGALSAKDKILIALACSVAIPCDICVEFHKELAISAGATREEMLEAAAIGGLVRLGSGFNAASLLLDDQERLSRYVKLHKHKMPERSWRRSSG